jgi:hypothetical protein
MLSITLGCARCHKYFSGGSAGNIFFADASNYRIREVVASTGIIRTVAGSGTTGCASGDPVGLRSRLGQPTRLYLALLPVNRLAYGTQAFLAEPAHAGMARDSAFATLSMKLWGTFSGMIERRDFESSLAHRSSGHREGLRNRASRIQLPERQQQPARHKCCSRAFPQF